MDHLSTASCKNPEPPAQTACAGYLNNITGARRFRVSCESRKAGVDLDRNLQIPQTNSVTTRRIADTAVAHTRFNRATGRKAGVDMTEVLSN